MKPKRWSSQTERRNTAHTGLQSDCNQTLLCQDVTSPSQPCHEGPPTWTHAPVRARSSPPFTSPAAPSSRGVQPGQGLSLNRRHLPVVSIAQLSVISHYFLNLFSAHEAQQVEGKASQPCSPEHHTAMLFICCMIYISLLTRQLKDIWKHFRAFLNNANKHKSAVFTVDFGQFFTVDWIGFFPAYIQPWSIQSLVTVSMKMLQAWKNLKDSVRWSKNIWRQDISEGFWSTRINLKMLLNVFLTQAAFH